MYICFYTVYQKYIKNTPYLKKKRAAELLP
jgi:hypothetical protein